MIGGIILIFFGIFLIIWGVLFLDINRYRKMVKWTADLRGVKPAISERTIKVGRIMSFVNIFIGIVLIIIGFFLNSYISMLQNI